MVPVKDIPGLTEILLSIPRERYLALQRGVQNVQKHTKRGSERGEGASRMCSLLPHSTLGPERKINDTRREGAREESGMKNSKFF